MIKRIFGATFILFFFMSFFPAQLVRGDVPPAQLQSETLNWQYTSSLTTGRFLAGAATWGNYMYMIGGQGAIAMTSVERASINADGSLGSWVTVASLPEGRQGPGVVVVGNRLYLIGGWLGSSNTPSAEVLYTIIAADGSLGSWITASSMTQPHAGHGVAVYNGALYALGGLSSGSTLSNTVEFAHIRADGSLSTWQETTAMQTPRHSFAIVQMGGFLYAITGASDAQNNRTNTVEYAPILADGSVGAWQYGPSVSVSRVYPSAVVINGAIYILGGANGGPAEAQSSVEVADILADHRLGNWSLSTPMLEALFGQSVVITSQALYVLGGGALSGYSNRVQFTPVAAVDDLYASPLDLDLNPATVRFPSAQPQTMRLTVRRQGGAANLENVQVDFYLGAPSVAAGGVFLSSVTTAAIAPNRSVISAEVNWNINAQGSYTLYAVIDPDGLVSESNETNNIISRTVSVLPPLGDPVNPVVESAAINAGDPFTTSRVVNLDVTATDVGTGVAHLLFIEYVYDQPLDTWTPAQITPWLPYSVAHSSYPLELGTQPGTHYIQVWGADRAGNISSDPALVWVNYLPDSDQVLQGDVRLFRLQLAAGDQVNAQLTSQTGEADLYAFHLGGTLGLWSESTYPVETLTFEASTAGLYQVEVEGFSISDYHLAISITPVAAPLYSEDPQPQRPRRSAYNNSVPLAGQDTGVPSAPAEYYQFYMPLTWR